MKISRQHIVIVTVWALIEAGHFVGLLHVDQSTFFIAVAAILTIVWTHADRVRGHAQETRAGLQELHGDVQELRGDVQELRSDVGCIGKQLQTNIYGLGLVQGGSASARGYRWASGGDDPSDTGPFRAYNGN